MEIRARGRRSNGAKALRSGSPGAGACAPRGRGKGAASRPIPGAPRDSTDPVRTQCWVERDVAQPPTSGRTLTGVQSSYPGNPAGGQHSEGHAQGSVKQHQRQPTNRQPKSGAETTEGVVCSGPSGRRLFLREAEALGGKGPARSPTRTCEKPSASGQQGGGLSGHLLHNPVPFSDFPGR